MSGDERATQVAREATKEAARGRSEVRQSAEETQ